MQQTSDTYKHIVSGKHRFETSIVVGENGRLVDEEGNLILFGGDAIVVDTGDPESGFRGNNLFSVKNYQELFEGESPGVGGAVSGYVDLEMVAPLNVSQNARIAIYCRAENEDEKSEWVPQGVYYMNTRGKSYSRKKQDIVNIHGCDAMLFAEETYPSDDQHDYPLLDTEMVKIIAGKIGVEVDDRTWGIMTEGYMFPLPVGYTMREVLRMIAASYAGGFIITQEGKLRLVSMF